MLPLNAMPCRLARSLVTGGAALAALVSPILAQSPDWRTASSEAEQLIAKSRRLGGASFAREARKVLDPWWKSPTPPTKILLQRATLLQRDHHFDEALTDLNRVLKHDPKSTEAWLMKTTILTVMGRFEEARKASIPLFGLAPPLVAVTAGTAPTSSNGNLQASYDLLLKTSKEHPNAPVSVRAWAQTALAEMAVRLGNAEDADQHFRSALVIDQTSPYLLNAFAHFLLEQKQAARVLDLLQESCHHLTLPWLLAEQQINGDSPAYQKALQALEKNMAEAHQNHGHSHGREEAIFYLHLKGNTREAIHQAIGNWKSQREAADLIILLEAAIAAEDVVTIANALTWIADKKFEDVRLTPLLKTARQLTAG